MDKLSVKGNFRMWNIMTLLVCTSILIGNQIYFALPVFTLMRIALLLGVVYFLFSKNHKYPHLYFCVILYFTVYAAWTFLISLFYPGSLNTSSVINFLIIPLLIIVLLSLLVQRPQQSLKYLYMLSMIYILIQTVTGTIEHFSGWHLSSSGFYGVEGSDRTTPTGLCHNPNDYAAMTALAMFFVIAYRKIFHAEKSQWISLFWFSIVSLCVFWTDCRTILLCEMLFVLFYFRRIIRKYWKSSLSIAIVALTGFFFFGLDHSMSTRFSLYRQAFCSLYDSYGLGFGINGDQYYFQQLDNYDICSGYTNAHSHLFQLLLTSGLPVFSAYIALFYHILRTIATNHGRNEFWILPFLYILTLFAPSSAQLLWGQYLYFCAFVCYAVWSDKERMNV